jgi:hypothetical protein
MPDYVNWSLCVLTSLLMLLSIRCDRCVLGACAPN